jgi:hypothetical protein
LAFFEGLRSRKKNTTTPPFFGQTIKRGVILYEKTNGFFVVQ